MILLTGSSGFIGKHLIKRLSNIVCYKKGDSLKGLKPDIIINLAGEIYDESKMFETNIQLVYDLLQLPYKRFFHICSSSVYGRKKEPIKETDSLNPQTLYEITKAAGSLLCQSRPNTIIIRPFSLYGSNDNPKKLFPTILRRENLEIYSGSHDWISIYDFIDALMIFLEKANNDVINLGTGISFTNLQVVQAFEKVLGKIKYKINNSYMKSYDSDYWVCDTTYAREKYGIKHKYNLEEGIRKFISENS